MCCYVAIQKSLDYVYTARSQLGRKYGRKEKGKRNRDRNKERKKDATNWDKGRMKKVNRKKRKLMSVNVSDLIFVIA